jgi:Protein of unknown function (DUF3309)
MSLGLILIIILVIFLLGGFSGRFGGYGYGFGHGGIGVIGIILLMPFSMASSKLFLELEIISVTRATDIASSFLG